MYHIQDRLVHVCQACDQLDTLLYRWENDQSSKVTCSCMVDPCPRIIQHERDRLEKLGYVLPIV